MMMMVVWLLGNGFRCVEVSSAEGRSIEFFLSFFSRSSDLVGYAGRILLAKYR